MILLDLVNNIALLVTLTTIYRVFQGRLNANSLRYRLLIGLLFGGVAVVGMMTPIQLLPGVIYDGRSIILSTAGLFGGPLIVSIAAILTAAYRYYLGGAGTWVGVGVIFMSSCVGVFYGELRRRKNVPVTAPYLLMFGLIVHILLLAIQQGLPGGQGLIVLQKIGLPILVMFPLGTVLVSLLFLDIENQVKNRKALSDSERMLTRAQQVAHVGSWTWFITENRFSGSEETYRIFGINKTAFNGDLLQAIKNAIHPEDRSRIEELNRLVVETGKPAPMEYRVIRPDGKIRIIWAEAGDIQLDSKGKPAVLSGIAQDITEWREAETDLRESESRYRNLIMSSPDAIFINHDDRVVLVNEAGLKLFGAQKEEDLLGKLVFELFHPDFHEQIRERINRMRTLNEPAPATEKQIVRLDGTAVDVEVVAAPFHFHGANDIHVILRDISNRKQMKQALIESHEMFTGLAEQVPGVIYTYKLDPDGKSRFPYASPGMWEIYEVTPDQAQEDATEVFSRLHPEDRDHVTAAILESARTLEMFHAEFRVILPQQGLRWRISNAKPERTSDGGTLWFGIISDFTERKLSEQKITEQLNELRRWHSVMLGRESRMIELKQEVNALLAQVAEPARYLSVTESFNLDSDRQKESL